MTTLTIQIKLDNEAFDATGAEVARILRKYSDRIEDTSNPEDLQQEKILDYNGNPVGAATIAD
ncbi:hypothetical protein [Chroococcidiopsis sp.]|uniref:hypothetical protein n=1 Tax=Chroococcidiopsis sp. TaxID=3088168 RepID=UPI003F2F274B